MFKNIKFILRPEKSFFITSIVYGIGVSLLTLAVPVSVQALINSVTFGVILQPLVVLSVVLLGLLLFSGALNALQAYTIETFQHHFYARTTSELTVKLMNAPPAEMKEKNGSDLVNRYFDIMTVQKSMASLLTGGVSITMQTITGMILLAFYHPYFLAFDIFLIISLFCVWKFYQRDGLQTSLKESSAKYKVASTFDELISLENFSKSKSRRERVVEKANEQIAGYINARKSHFKIIFKQKILLLIIYALMSALILGLGGYLVIKEQLSLGQLVAAELVVTVILASFSKAYKYLEAFYDLYTACEKLSVFYSLEDEDNLDLTGNELQKGNLSLKGVKVRVGDSDYIYNHTFESGKRYLVKPQHYTYKAIFLDLIQGNVKPDKGAIYLGNQFFNEISPLDVRDHIYVANKPRVIQGTLGENLGFGNGKVRQAVAREILDVCDLKVAEDYFKKGLNLELLPTGYPLWSNQISRLELGRVLLSNSEVVVLSDFFDQIEEERRNKFLKKLFSTQRTVILISNHDYSGFYFDKYLTFRDGNIHEENFKGRTVETKSELPRKTG